MPSKKSEAIRVTPNIPGCVTKFGNELSKSRVSLTGSSLNTCSERNCMKPFYVFVSLVLLMAAFRSTAASQSTTLPQLNVEKHTLSNGLDVLMVEDHRLPRVAVDVWYHVGPVNEE